MKISFCVTCRNRLWQLEQTLLPNLESIGDHNISLVNYGSEDEMDALVWEELSSYISSGRLTYFNVLNPVEWHASRAKNLAHRIAPGDYLFNLDADNFVTPADVSALEKAASKGWATHQFTGNWQDGSYGRIGVPRETFYLLGGYDEGLLPMGAQDYDLLNRIQQAGIPLARMSKPYLDAVQNETEHKVSEVGKRQNHNMSSQDKYDLMNKTNAQTSHVRLLLEGTCRLNQFATFLGKLNGRLVVLDGLGHFHDAEKTPYEF